MDSAILLKISEIVATALDTNDPGDLGAALNSVIPDNISRQERAAALEQAYVYSLVCEQPGYDPDGNPGYLPADADLKQAVLNEIDAMIRADFDRAEHRQTWEKLRESVAATPEAEFTPGVAVNCPDDYLLSLDKTSCSEILKRKGLLPAWAAPYIGA